MINHYRLFASSIQGACVCVLVSLGISPAFSQDFQFDGSITRPVLENYLERSITFAELLHDDLNQPRNSQGVDPRDNVRLLLSSGAKFVGRALIVWGREQELATFLKTAKPYAALLHKGDPEIILQAAEFEIVTPGVESVSIPEHVFHEFSLPVENRHFRYRDMLYADGRFVDHWGRGGSVPDMSRLETRMWFYFLAACYIDIGIEAIHFGQVSLMNRNDPGHAHWIDMLTRAVLRTAALAKAFSALRCTRRLGDTWRMASFCSTSTRFPYGSPKFLVILTRVFFASDIPMRSS